MRVIIERIQKHQRAMNFRSSHALRILSGESFTMAVRAPWYKRMIGIKTVIKRFGVVKDKA